MPSIAIDTAVLGTTTLVAAQGANKIIKVVGLNITSANTVTVSLLSNATLLWKTFATTVAGGGVVLPDDPDRDMYCAPNQPLVLNLSAAVAVAGSLNYTVVGV